MNPFDYAAPKTIDEAVAMLGQRNGRARVLAGGTDIIVQLREGLREADLVVDVKHIEELMSAHFRDDGGLTLGASVPCTWLYRDDRVKAAYPALADSARIIGGWQIQTRASVGGNLCNSSPAADSIPSLMAHEAVCEIAGPGGRREVAVSAFCTGPGRNVLEPGELLVALRLPPPAARTASAYERFIPRNEMDIAVVGAGSWIELDASGQAVVAARIALGAVAPTPVLAEEAAAWLVGKPATEASFAEAGAMARAVARPISDMRGDSEYRTHLVGVLVKRTLARAAERAAS